MEMTRRGFLRLFASAAAVAAAPSLASVEFSVTEDAEEVSSGLTQFGMVREATAYDTGFDRILYRLDIRTAKDQFCVLNRVTQEEFNSPDFNQRIREPMISILGANMAASGIKPSDLLPWDHKPVDGVRFKLTDY